MVAGILKQLPKPGLFTNALLRTTTHSLWLDVLAPAPST